MCGCVLTENHVTFHSRPLENDLIPDTLRTASIFCREPPQAAHVWNGDETETGVEEAPNTSRVVNYDSFGPSQICLVRMYPPSYLSTSPLPHLRP